MLRKLKRWLSGRKHTRKREAYTPRIKVPETQARITWPRDKKY